MDYLLLLIVYCCCFLSYFRIDKMTLFFMTMFYVVGHFYVVIFIDMTITFISLIVSEFFLLYGI